MNRLIIVGSPRLEGRSARLANQLFEACIDECPDDELALVPVSEVNVAGCTGCGVCARLAIGENFEDVIAQAEGAELAADFEDDRDGVSANASEVTDGSVEGAKVDQPQKAPAQKSKQAAQFDHPRRCAIDDDMGDIYELIDDAEELTIVSPVYFAGPPSQLKALLDRLQPYYAQTAAERAAAAQEGREFKTAIKPAVLHVVGEGSDPHGFAALVTIVQSALAVAGYRLETVLDWVGKIAPDGEILEEAEVIDLIAEDEEVYADVSVVFGDEYDEGDEGFGKGFDEDFDRGFGGSFGEDFDDAADDAFDDSYDGPYDDASDEIFDGYYDEPAPSRPQLSLNDTQVEERGRASSEAGRSGGKKGKTDKRTSKGGTQTNNRNPRKENQAKSRKRHANNAPSGKGSSNKGSSGKSPNGKAQNSKASNGKGPNGKGRAGSKGAAGKVATNSRDGAKGNQSRRSGAGRSGSRASGRRK